ncbi:hypothetical protein [Sphingomonas jatrophae]|uniref:Transglycosylase SLT domain-containing protein n=1 Tax=Sphingomonas jatrophae TaxID=1166337 RepID=A0A1I6MAJ0_9SPHN|nr:hypothetical protein [Sphingomonas jatrophae]SFS12729.1 hypothetical protein SAMN05192580_3798 [Sphingomonas jatrophae]
MSRQTIRPTLDQTGDAQAIRRAIGRAANRTGVDFTYLLNQAKSESGLNPTAKAGNSSATGLYQFIDQSWLGVMKQHGAEHGYGWAADAIHRQGGRWTVKSEYREAVFALRKDPEASSLMAAAYASDNAAGLKQSLGRDVGSTDLYFAHFLGLHGAKKFLKAADHAPGATAAALFPREAAANRTIFYTKSGEARSLGQVYALMGRKIGGPAEAPPVADDPGPTLMAEDQALSPTPPEVATVQLAALTTEGASAPSPLEAMLGQQAQASAGIDLLKPQPGQARLAYLMVLNQLGTV